MVIVLSIIAFLLAVIAWILYNAVRNQNNIARAYIMQMRGIHHDLDRIGSIMRENQVKK